MSRSLDLTQRQVRAIIAGAKKEGRTPAIQVGKMLVLLIPEEHAREITIPQRVDDEEDFRL